MLAILDVFSIDSPFLTISEISRSAGLPMSTTHRLVHELVAEGLLETVDSPQRQLRLGNRLWELGTRTPGALGLREIAQPHMSDLQQRVAQHVQLAVRYGLDTLILERISHPRAVVSASVVGGRMLLPHTALGLVILAFGDETVIEDVLEHGLEPPTPAAIDTPERLLTVLATIERRGFASADGFIFSGSRGVAAPVRTTDGTVVAAIGVVVANDGSRVEAVAMAVKQTAADIGRSLSRAYLPSGHPQALPGGSSRVLVRSSLNSMQFLGRPRRTRKHTE
ncbi:MAG: IclR family transcriptional regulator [Beutenbergiaceae bacterium]